MALNPLSSFQKIKPDYGRSSNLAVLLHADIVGSTSMAQRNEVAAHERIKNAFQRFNDVIVSYRGKVKEIRGDALVAQFERASDAVAAALSFLDSQVRQNEQLIDEMLTELRVGIALGEVVIDDHIITGSGVVLAQRVEQLAAPNGLCITTAIQEVLPRHMPFELEDLGAKELKGFGEKVRVYRVSVRHGEAFPAPYKADKPDFTSTLKKAIKPVLISVLIIGGGAAIDIGYEHLGRPSQMELHWLAPAIETARKNPVQVTTESLEIGANVYRKNCASCHGENADGNGLAGGSLAPNPANLHMMSKSHADGEFAYKIRSGRGAMPGWEGILAETEIWSLINYISSIHELPSERSIITEAHRGTPADLTNLVQ